MRPRDLFARREVRGALLLAAAALCVLLVLNLASDPVSLKVPGKAVPDRADPLAGSGTDAGPGLAPGSSEAGSPAAPPLPDVRREPAMDLHPLTVQVLDPDDRSLPGAVVRVEEIHEGAVVRGGFALERIADGRGTARFDVPAGVDLQARLVLQAAADEVTGTMPAPLRPRRIRRNEQDAEAFRTYARAPVARVDGPHLALQLVEGLRLEVTLLDGVQRKRIRGQVAVRPSFATFPVDGSTPRSLWMALMPGAEAPVVLQARPRGEGLSLAQELRWDVSISPAAELLTAEVPVWPEADVYVTWRRMPDLDDLALLPQPTVVCEGAPVVDARFTRGENNTLILRGVPEVPGGLVEVAFDLADEHLRGRVVLLHPSRRIPWEIEMERGEPDAASWPPWTVGGPARMPEVLPVGDPLDPYRPGALKIVVDTGKARWRGRSLVGWAGRSLLTRRTGTLTLADVPEGLHEVTVRSSGSPLRLTGVPVAFDEEAVLVARVREPVTLAVEVVDQGSRRLPFARFDVHQLSRLGWCDLEGETQRIDPFTDEKGERTLRGIEWGPVEVVARRGLQRGRAHAEVPSGTLARLKLALDEPVDVWADTRR